MSQPYHSHHVTNTTSSTQSSGALSHAHAPPSGVSSSFQPASMHKYVNNRATEHPPSPSPSTSPSSHHQQGRLVAVAPRSCSLPQSSYMGTGQSKQAAPLPPTPPDVPQSATTKGINAAVAGGIKLKRAFAGRRKKSEDVRSRTELSQLQQTTTPSPSSWVRMDPPSPSGQILEQTQLQTSPLPLASPPPPPPPKKEYPTTLESLSITPGNRTSVILLSPGISSAVNYMMHEQASPMTHATPTAHPTPASDKENTRHDSMKESWRKSDSTNSHHTIRQSANATSRNSRPVSWAESFQSAHTVVQGTGSNKRLSALIGDADFGMAEEDDEDSSSSEEMSYSAPATVAIPRASPPITSSDKSKNRRSMSLSMGTQSAKPQEQLLPPQPTSASAAEMKFPSYSFSEGVPPPNIARQPPRAPAISQSSSSPSNSNDTKGRYSTWQSSNNGAPPVSLARHEQQLPPLPGGNAEYSSAPRQPTSSMSGNNPASAAAGFAKRAVEKMGRKWGVGVGNMMQNVQNMGMTIGGMGSLGQSSSSSGSGYSSSASSSRDLTSISSNPADYGLARTSSNGSGPTSSSMHSQHSGSQGKVYGHGHGFLTSPKQGHLGHGQNHKQKGSVSSSISAGDSSDPFGASSGPTLGELLRPGRPGAKLVFGKDLKTVTRETAIQVGRNPSISAGKRKAGLIGDLETRKLPAIVVRCAQHVLMWGVQEEGLFRVSGRPSHVTKLRVEFDSGVDYDMSECTPGDLDPHAVASVFKAFLREMPEQILTQRLQPVFEAAINKETQLNIASAEAAHHSTRSVKPGQGLPTGGPKGGFALRKPPSLSTLAMPTFNGLPPASKPLVAAVRTLIAQLPIENRDLLHTVVDLIKATARGSKETKMPLSNLLLVFTPSLNMTPPLLKVLCEAEGIWTEDGVDKEYGDSVEEGVIDIRRRTVVPGDAKPPPTPTKDREYRSPSSAIGPEESEDGSMDSRSGMLGEADSLRSARVSLENPSSDYHASGEDDASSSFYEDGGAAGAAVAAVAARRRRQETIDRPEVPTVYLDTRSHLSSSSISSLQDPSANSRFDHDVNPYYMHHSRDAATDDGSISSGPYSMNRDVYPYRPHQGHPDSPSPPPLSSSESVATPTSSNPSFTNLPLDGDDIKDKDNLNHPSHQRHALALDLAESAPLELRSGPKQTSKRPVISNPIPIVSPPDSGVQFPTAAPTQQTRPAPSRRRSIPILSFPSLGYGSEPSSAQTSPKLGSTPAGEKSLLRSKKPSLTLLFSKRSASSLNADKDKGLPFISAPLPHSSYGEKNSPRSSTASSVSTPLSAVTAPQSSRSVSGSMSTGSSSHLPPVLDTPIEGGSLMLDLGFDLSSPPPIATAKPKSDSTENLRPRQDSQSLSSQTSLQLNLPTIQPLSIISRKSSESQKSTGSQDHRIPPVPIRSQTSTSNISIVSTASRLSLLGDDEPEEEDDWTQSVLLAASVGDSST